MQDEYVKNCPFCGRNEMIKCHETGYTIVTAVNNVWVSLWEELLYIIPFEQILNELVSMNKVITSGATKGRRYI